MEEEKMLEFPEIRYHITYDEKLTFKDLEDLLHLIRISNNDILHKLGFSRPDANDLQRIEKIEPGSIEIVMGIIEAINHIASIVTAIKFIKESIDSIRNKIKLRQERRNRSPKEDKKVYDKYEVTVEIEERQNPMVYVVHIHVCKRKIINC